MEQTSSEGKMLQRNKFSSLISSIVLTMLTAVTMTGCAATGGYVEVECEVPTKKCSIRGRVEYKPGTEPDTRQIYGIQLVTETTNLSLVPPEGEFLIKVKNSSNALLAAKRFTFYRSGNNFYPNDMSAIENWLAEIKNFSSVEIDFDGLDYAITNSNASGGSIEARWLYNNEVVASNTTYVSFDGYNNEPCCTKIK